MTRVLFLISLAGFATALFARAVDPIVPPIAAGLAMDPRTVALLSTAFAIPFALVPPILGPLGDMFGKVRLIKICLGVLVLSGLGAIFATSFSALLASRIVAGVAAGGVFPLSLALFGDHVPVHARQIAIGQLLSVTLTGNLLGAALSGVIADIAGWRVVFVVLTAFGAVAFVGILLGLRGAVVPTTALLDWRAVPASYRAIFANPRARYVFLAVFLEGLAIFGLFPYVALLLHAAGEERSSIAGLLIAGFSIGGLGYTVVVLRAFHWFTAVALMTAGSLCAALALCILAFQPPWPAQLAAFAVLGLGFYTLHGYIQVQSTELSSTARGAAVALHASFFFLGHGAGPVVYGLGIATIGTTLSLIAAAACVAGVGLLVRARLGSRRL